MKNDFPVLEVAELPYISVVQGTSSSNKICLILQQMLQPVGSKEVCVMAAALRAVVGAAFPPLCSGDRANEGG